MPIPNLNSLNPILASIGCRGQKLKPFEGGGFGLKPVQNSHSISARLDFESLRKKKLFVGLSESYVKNPWEDKRRQNLSVSASWETKLPDVLGLCPNMCQQRAHGYNLLGVLGKSVAQRTWSSLRTQATSLSRPRPKPLCGTEPCFLRSRYHS